MPICDFCHHLILFDRPVYVKSSIFCQSCHAEYQKEKAAKKAAKKAALAKQSRICATCNTDRPMYHFIKNTKADGGHGYHCRDCINKRKDAKAKPAVKKKVVVVVK